MVYGEINLRWFGRPRTRHLWRAGYAERCPSGSEGDGWKRAVNSNAVAVYPIVDVTDSNSVSPTKKATSPEAAFFLLLLLERRCPYSLITGAVNTSSLPNATLRVDQFCLVLWQQARYLLQHSIEKLIFRNSFDHFTLAKDHTPALTSSKAHIGVA